MTSMFLITGPLIQNSVQTLAVSRSHLDTILLQSIMLPDVNLLGCYLSE